MTMKHFIGRCTILPSQKRKLFYCFSSQNLCSIYTAVVPRDSVMDGELVASSRRAQWDSCPMEHQSNEPRPPKL